MLQHKVIKGRGVRNGSTVSYVVLRMDKSECGTPESRSCGTATLSMPFSPSTDPNVPNGKGIGDTRITLKLSRMSTSELRDSHCSESMLMSSRKQTLFASRSD